MLGFYFFNHLQPFTFQESQTRNRTYFMSKHIFITIAILSLSLLGCQKAELKKPTDLELSFDFKKNFNSNIKIKIISGQINLVEFGMNGTRVEGDPIQFSEKIENLNISLDGQVNADLIYQIPQGIYNYMQIKATIAPNGNLPAIAISGTFKESNTVTKNIQFTHNYSQVLVIIGESSNEGDIVLTKSKVEKIDLIFDAIYWFETITENQLKTAQLSDYNGIETIVISDESNVDLYEIITARMNNDQRAIFY